MISKVHRSIKTFILKWLAKELFPFIAAQNEVSKINDFRMATSARLGKESSIENLANDPERIFIDENSYIRGRLLTYGHGGYIKIGKWCYIGVRSEIWSMESITIGDRVLISHDVNIHDGTAHSLDAIERHQHFKQILKNGHPKESLPGVSCAPIIIEDDVWISFNVTILKGVRIGKGSVIAAGSIVTEDIPPGTLYKCKITPQLTQLILPSH